MTHKKDRFGIPIKHNILLDAIEKKKKETPPPPKSNVIKDVVVDKGLIGDKTVTETIGGVESKFTKREFDDLVSARFSGSTIGLSEDQKQAFEQGNITPEKRAQEAALQAVGQVQLTGDVLKDKLSIEQAIKSALASASAGVVGGAAVGAVAGGVPTAGIGAIPGAIALGTVTGVGAFIGGFRANLKTQRTDMVKGEAQNLMKAEQNMLKLVMETNKFGDYSSTLPMFNAQLSLIDENEVRLNKETKDDTSKWLGEDGHKQLEKYENFNSVGGMRDILELQMRNAIQNPDPNSNALLQQYFDANLGDALAEADL